MRLRPRELRGRLTPVSAFATKGEFMDGKGVSGGNRPFSAVRRRIMWLVVAGVGVLALVSGAAASVPTDANGVIHGCYSKTSGSLRIIGRVSGRDGIGQVKLILPALEPDAKRIARH